MAKTPAPVKGQYVITRSRHIDGEHVLASPEFPAVLEVEAGFPVDSGMIPLEKFARVGQLKPHYIPRRGPYMETPAEEVSKPKVTVVATGGDLVTPPAPAAAAPVVPEPPAVTQVPAMAQAAAVDKGKRPSDKSPV